MIEEYVKCATNMEYRLDDGTLHRVNGPAYIRYGFWSWLLCGEYHRYYGPQNRFGSWLIHNKRVK